MALSSEDFQNVRISLDENTRAMRELTQAMQRTPQGSASQSGSGPATPGAPQGIQGAGSTGSGSALGPGVGSSGGAKSDSAAGLGLGLSNVRQLLNSGGFSMAGSLVGGLAGGAAGLGFAAANLGAHAVGDYVRQKNTLERAKAEGLASAPIGISAGDAEYVSNQDAKIARIRDSAMGGIGHPENWESWFAGTVGKQREYAEDAEREVRKVRQETDARLGPTEQARALTARQFAGFAAAGGLEGAGRDDAIHLMRQRFDFNLARARRMHDMNNTLREMDDLLTPSRPGAQSAQLGK